MKKTRSNLGVSFCEMPAPKKPAKAGDNRSAVYSHKGDFSWKGVKDEPYKTEEGDWSDIIRRVLIGSHGESTRFHVRYFEILANGHSSLEQHRHEHVVICVKGEGVVRFNKTKKKIGFMDVVYIAPDALHQLSNPFSTPFGFLCIVNSRRDRPKLAGR